MPAAIIVWTVGDIIGLSVFVLLLSIFVIGVAAVLVKEYVGGVVRRFKSKKAGGKCL